MHWSDLTRRLLHREKVTQRDREAMQTARVHSGGRKLCVVNVELESIALILRCIECTATAEEFEFGMVEIILMRNPGVRLL